MMDQKTIMASDELPEERVSEWVSNADAIFQLVKVRPYHPRGRVQGVYEDSPATRAS